MTIRPGNSTDMYIYGYVYLQSNHININPCDSLVRVQSSLTPHIVLTLLKRQWLRVMWYLSKNHNSLFSHPVALNGIGTGKYLIQLFHLLQNRSDSCDAIQALICIRNGFGLSHLGSRSYFGRNQAYKYKRTLQNELQQLLSMPDVSRTSSSHQHHIRN